MISPIVYVKNNELNLFCRPDFGGLAYSDGETTEQRLYESVCRARDRSTLSLELARSIVDWPSEYHLSRERHCLVRPLGIRRGDKVLELGSGCGAITRFLGEIGAEVTAVEGSLQRARIAAERCRDLPNVQVVVDDLLRFQTTDRFQWVLLVGVLEYASVFSDRQDAAEHYLRSAARFLTPAGKLVIAIENKLGLKYFNGLAEDHLGIPFAGIQGLYGERTPRTFGRRELELKIRGAGLDHFEFYYPFPDYKLPRVVFSERAFSEEGFEPSDLLATCVPRDYGRDFLRAFDDALVNSEVAKNGLLAGLSNSFLVVASQQPFRSESSDLAVAFAASRVREFATQTRFVRSSTGIQVIKEALDSLAVRQALLKDGSTLRNLLEPAKYVRGRLLYWRLLVARAKYGGPTAIIDALRPWFQFLLKQVNTLPGTSNRISDILVSGRTLDLTPSNLIEGSQGIVAIDTEWAVDGDIPLGWVVTRSVRHALPEETDLEGSPFSVHEVIKTLCSESGLLISDSEIEDFLDREADLQAVIIGLEPEKTSLKISLPTLLEPHQPEAEPETQVGIDCPAKVVWKEHENLRRDLKRDETITWLRAKAAESEQAIRARDESIAWLTRQVEESEQAIRSRDQAIAWLQEKSDEREKIIHARDESIARLRAQAEDGTT